MALHSMAFQAKDSPNQAAAPLKDPVCGMTVTPQSPHALQHEGKPIYFCSAGCKGKFAANPAAYLANAPASALNAVWRWSLKCPRLMKVRAPN